MWMKEIKNPLSPLPLFGNGMLPKENKKEHWMGNTRITTTKLLTPTPIHLMKTSRLNILKTIFALFVQIPILKMR